MENVAFPLVSPAPEPTAWVLKGSAGSSPTPLSLQTQARSMSVPKRRSRSSVRDTGGRGGCTPGKGRDTFVVG